MAGIPVLLVLALLLDACGGAGQGSPSGGPSAAAEASIEASPSAAALSGALVARPLGSMDGAPLGYLEYLPPGYGDGEPRPLLVFLHGTGEAGNGSEAALDLVDDFGIPPLIAAGAWPADRPFVLLAPQYGTAPAEGRCGIAEDIADFLEFATKHYKVDVSRLYLTGISCGAIGVWDYLAAHSDEAVAAAVPISGHALWALEKVGCAPLAKVPVWAFHGAKDDTVPVAFVEGQIDQIRACDGAESVEVELTVYPDADHDAWSRTYDLSAGNDIYAWLLEHTNTP